MGQSRDGDPVVVADDHRLDYAGTMDQQTDLPIQFRGQCGQRPSGLPTDDLLGCTFFLSKPFQISQLLRLQPVGVAGNRSDDLLLGGQKFSREHCPGSVGKG